jgi:hypothetical protein
MNPEFKQWLEEQECYPFSQGRRLKQSLYGDYMGIKTVKQIIDEKQKRK